MDTPNQPKLCLTHLCQKPICREDNRCQFHSSLKNVLCWTCQKRQSLKKSDYCPICLYQNNQKFVMNNWSTYNHRNQTDRSPDDDATASESEETEFDKIKKLSDEILEKRNNEKAKLETEISELENENNEKKKELDRKFNLIVLKNMEKYTQKREELNQESSIITKKRKIEDINDDIDTIKKILKAFDEKNKVI